MNHIIVNIFNVMNGRPVTAQNSNVKTQQIDVSEKCFLFEFIGNVTFLLILNLISIITAAYLQYPEDSDHEPRSTPSLKK